MAVEPEILVRDGVTGQGETAWTLRVPDEHCKPGLEVRIIAAFEGLKVGGELIPWSELDAACGRLAFHTALCDLEGEI